MKGKPGVEVTCDARLPAGAIIFCDLAVAHRTRIAVSVFPFEDAALKFDLRLLGTYDRGVV
jgi:hypothetical protein